MWVTNCTAALSIYVFWLLNDCCMRRKGILAFDQYGGDNVNLTKRWRHEYRVRNGLLPLSRYFGSRKINSLFCS